MESYASLPWGNSEYLQTPVKGCLPEAHTFPEDKVDVYGDRRLHLEVVGLALEHKDPAARVCAVRTVACMWVASSCAWASQSGVFFFFFFFWGGGGGREGPGRDSLWLIK